MLAIITTHPIQYQVPIWKALAQRGRVPFRVFFMSEQGWKSMLDPGFGAALKWDIDLLGGYPSSFLRLGRRAPAAGFWSLRLGRCAGALIRHVQPSVIWIQGWQVAAYWQAAFAAARAGAHVWLRAESNLYSGRKGFRRSLRERALKHLFSRVDQFLYIGEANKAFYRAHGVPDHRLAPAPYCVDNARLAQQADAARSERMAIRRRWRIPEAAYCFLFVGKFVPKKRPLDLVRAVAKLQSTMRGVPIHILWVGAGELGRVLREACDVHYDAEPTPSVFHAPSEKPSASFVGFLNQTELGAGYAAADCLVLPSDSQETWGLVVNEAMASGVPCVVSDACGCANDLVRPIRPDLCYPVGNTTALQRALASAMNYPPTHRNLTDQISKYDYLHTVQIVEELYRGALATR